MLVYLAATPFVYNEDFAWSVALTLGSVFALLGVLERPSWGRVTAAGVLILFTNLDRTPTGYACVIGALLVAAWFLLGRDGRDNRRWVVPMIVVGLVPLAVSCAVTWIKFGLPFGLPMADQVWAHINAHRRYFLAANNGKAFSVGFIPSTAFAYLQPFGIRFSSVFPFITLPTAPAAAYGGVVLDQTYQTGSIPATMPLLFLLSCWGAITAFRRRQVGRVALLRIPILTAAVGVTGVLVWGYIADRYLADFLPLLVVAGAVGLVDIWRRVNGRSLEIPLAHPHRSSPRSERSVSSPTWRRPSPRADSGPRRNSAGSCRSSTRSPRALSLTVSSGGAPYPIGLPPTSCSWPATVPVSTSRQGSPSRTSRVSRSSTSGGCPSSRRRTSTTRLPSS